MSYNSWQEHKVFGNSIFFLYFFLSYAGCILKVLPTLYNSDESNFSVLRG